MHLLEKVENTLFGESLDWAYKILGIIGVTSYGDLILFFFINLH